MKFPVPKMPKLPKPLKSVKYVLGAVNSAFLVTGLLLLIVGVIVLVIYSEYEDLITKKFFTIPSFIIATGIIIVLTSILGFYGAISEKFHFIAGYTILLVVILVFEMAIVVQAYAMEDNAASEIQSTMLTSLRQYDTHIQVAQMWDEMQQSFSCCGVAGRFDYVSNLIPVSCCHIDYGVIGTFVCETTNSFAMGCAEALGELLSYYAHVLAITSLVVTCIQIPVTVVAAWMTYRSKYQEVELES